MKNEAILLVSFGTSYPKAFKEGIESVEVYLKERFSECHVAMAFTSGMIMKKVRERDGIVRLNVEEALLKLKEDSYDRIYVQPTHMIPGFEYEKIQRGVSKAKHQFKDVEIVLGRPLLDAEEDYRAVVDTFRKEMEAMDEAQGLVFMGHGTEHFANAAYFRLQQYLWEVNSNVHIALVEADPDFDTVIDRVVKSGLKRVTLVPLMTVAGDHAANDMASEEEEDSLLMRFRKAGVECEARVQGLGALASIRKIYGNHVEAMM